MKHAFLSMMIAVAALLLPASARATAIEFQATHVSGVVWQYDYFIASGNFDAQQGFVVFFDESLYANLLLVSPGPADWDVLTLDPDLVLQSDGTYDALALVNNPSFTGPFSVTFDWLGVADPGSQPFEKYAPDVSGLPVTIETGVTTRRSVPEPATVLLLAVGGAGLLRRKRSFGLR